MQGLAGNHLDIAPCPSRLRGPVAAAITQHSYVRWQASWLGMLIQCATRQCQSIWRHLRGPASLLPSLLSLLLAKHGLPRSFAYYVVVRSKVLSAAAAAYRNCRVQCLQGHIQRPFVCALLPQLAKAAQEQTFTWCLLQQLLLKTRPRLVQAQHDPTQHRSCGRGRLAPVLHSICLHVSLDVHTEYTVG